MWDNGLLYLSNLTIETHYNSMMTVVAKLNFAWRIKKFNAYILETKEKIHKNAGLEYSPKFNAYIFSFQQMQKSEEKGCFHYSSEY